MNDGALSDTDLGHLRRCIELAGEALADADGPFGSVLVTADGERQAEDRNREHTTGDETAHPEFTLARWAATNLTPEQRAGATVYTSGEHCPMCAAANGWVGIGRIVYAASSAQLMRWRAKWGAPPPPVRPLPIQKVAPAIKVEGPAPQLIDEIRELHARASQGR